MLPILQTALDKLEDLLDTAKNTAVAGEDVPGKMFLPAVAVYKQLYEDLGVKTTEEYDAKLSTADGDDGIDIIYYCHIFIKKLIKCV